METNFLFGISLTASFLAGVIALFAPCCISFLFPAYLGTIFKESKKVVFYTIVFALGLASILIPIALGFRFFISVFDNYHKAVYYLGGLFLIFMGINTIKPLFYFPTIFQKPHVNKKVNIGSVFTLGVFSGLSSSCCAPVLFAAVALTTLSPNIFQALVVSLAYVLGIVFPLFILSLFYKKATNKISGNNRYKIYKLFSNIGALIFIVSGALIIVFNYLDKIQMYQAEGYSQAMRLIVYQFAKYFQNPFIDIFVFLAIVFVFYKMLRRYEE